MNEVISSSTMANEVASTNAKNERTYPVCLAESYTSTNWKQRNPTWARFQKEFRNIRRTAETADEYQAMDKSQKLKVKSSFGGYFCGVLKGKERKKSEVLSKSMLIYDIDDVQGISPKNICSDFEREFPTTAMECCSTHGHTKEKPRLRFAIPCDMDLSNEEFTAIKRYVAWKWKVLDIVDQTTFQFERMYFWNTAPKNGDVFQWHKDGIPLKTREILSAYNDRKKAHELFKTKKENFAQGEKGKLPKDPRKIGGFVGAFCRAYPISVAIETFLSDVYRFEYERGNERRYSCLRGHSYAGLIVRDDLFAYAYQNKDKANNGHQVNSFDLVKVNLFGNDKDSYNKMIKFASDLEAVQKEMVKSSFDSKVMHELCEEDSENIPNWLLSLEKDSKGKVKPKITNIRAILENDPKLKGHIRLNRHSGYITASKELFWNRKVNCTKDKIFDDFDETSLSEYLEKTYSLERCDTIISKAVNNVANENSYHPICDYLNSLKWDGTKRIEMVFSHYLGAEDTELNRAIAKLFFVSAVARVMSPGCKYDYCIVIAGDEAIGKSSFFRILGGLWYLDTPSIDGKDGMSQLRGFWIIELSELAGFNKSEIEYIKGFITRETDVYRKAYGKEDKAYDRQCVLCGTTNETNFLKSQTGNRRFLIVDVDKDRRKDFLSTDEARRALERERNQLWAEAVYIYKREKPKLYLDSRFEAMAKEIQELHNERENDPIYTKLEIFLKASLPTDWNKKSLLERRSWWQAYEDNKLISAGGVVRERICAPEYLVECIGLNTCDKSFKLYATRVNKWLSEKKDLRDIGRQRTPLYGYVKTFEVIKSNTPTMEYQISECMYHEI